MIAGLIKVLVVDDSAFVRKTIKAMLSRSAFIEVVGTASDGQEALELIPQLNPDVVTLDLIMPYMSGLEFLREQMARRPLPMIVVSIAEGNSQQVVAALAEGAVDFIHKPTALASEGLLQMTDELIAKVKSAAKISIPSLPPPTNTPEPTTKLLMTPKKPPAPINLVAIGISTGGPAALSHMIPELPENFPVPIAIVMHMLEGYTEIYAQRLDQQSPLKVVEAKHGDILRPGIVYIARAGQHMTFTRQADAQVATRLSFLPLETIHRPSVDVMFESAAQIFGDRVLGVVMTGMGSDGHLGAAMIKSQGGLIFTEHESTCVVYGMPAVVEENGLSDLSVPLSLMATAILHQVKLHQQT
ncbi:MULTISPECIES: chemotaxis-specific protein-glutamate methyltransferase CheB [Planktothricoides]|uniref:Protein-glutamate methylesterase/protein-glutamine glutaminase n=1 Tax=Planktothricoides raciborskii GIHE-MW2 TaxID=2792601 RepID=A0AAU8JKL5_9CYAN|nr:MULTISPECIES: chemotaxis-specific protein-glutamate methyltransferase CheB [Planktothricoides]KOR37844.1 glutamate methylesterase [Planktothricoides sp. SR001]